MIAHHKASAKLDNDHSIESGVLEQGNVQNIQDSGPWGPWLKITEPWVFAQTFIVKKVLLGEMPYGKHAGLG